MKPGELILFNSMDGKWLILATIKPFPRLFEDGIIYVSTSMN